MSEADRPLLLQEYRPVTQLKTTPHLLARAKRPAIEAHAHFGDLYCPLYSGSAWQPWTPERIDAMVDSLRGLGITRAVNLDGFWDGFLGIELNRLFAMLRPWDDFFMHFVSVDTRAAGTPDFEQGVKDYLTRAKDLGARGIKLFKHLSLMTERSPYEFVPGRGLLPDDARLSVIWDTAAELALPVLIHIADPPAFFEPVDERNERHLELKAHPDWAYHGSGTYTYDELMQAQVRLLGNHPNTRFIIPHVGSASEDLAFVSNCMERFPNMHVDIAARIGELGKQPYTSRAFFERFADRILFGTDAYPDVELTRRYPSYFRFLETYDEGIANGALIGIGLSDDILEKVYTGNARRILGA